MNLSVFKKLILLVAGFAFLSGCSQQNRTADSPIFYEELVQYLEDILPAFSSASAEDAEGFINSDYSSIFFAEGCADCAFGSAQSVLSLKTLEFMAPDLYPDDLTHAVVVYFDEYGEAGDRFSGLIIDYSTINEELPDPKYYASVEAINISKDSVTQQKKYSVIMSDMDTGEEIMLETFDVETNGDLKKVVTFKVYSLLGDQAEMIGTLSTLVGFFGSK